MIYYYSIKSGSDGNSTLYKINNIFILIDIGISLKYLTKALANINLSIFDINYIFLTHEHIDHIKGINTFIKYSNIPIYCSCKIANKIIKLYPDIKKWINIFKFNQVFVINNFINIQALKIPHDSLENTGYILKFQEHKLAHFTDLGFVPLFVTEKIINCHTIILEANYDINMLLYSKYPYTLKTRIASINGHLSNLQALNLSIKLIQKNTKNIILSHLSEKNNSIDIINKNIIEVLKEKFSNKKFNVLIAPLNFMDNMLKLI